MIQIGVGSALRLCSFVPEPGFSVNACRLLPRRSIPNFAAVGLVVVWFRPGLGLGWAGLGIAQGLDGEGGWLQVYGRVGEVLGR